MKKFVLKSSVFFICLLVSAFLLDHIISQGLSKTDYRSYQEWNQIYGGKINADLIILGSSRARNHVSPSILDSVLNINSFNLGMPGYKFMMQLSRYHVYRKYNIKPKYIIQILDINLLSHKQNLYEYQQFLPYFNDTTITNSISKFDGLTWFDYKFPAYRYTGLTHLIDIGIMEYLNLRHYSSFKKYKGYYSSEKKWDGSFESFKLNFPSGVDVQVSNEYLKKFNEFMKDCQNQGITVFLVFAPEYYEIQEYLNGRNNIMGIYKKLADRYGFYFMDFSLNPISYDKKLFYNSQHLNKDGAELFSQMLAKEIKEIINNSVDGGKD